MEKKQFQAESKRLLDLMINSIYTHREIFLRELISNASDAIDKLAYQALTDDTVGLSRSDFAIHLATDEGARTLTVSDNGIGMTREEMEENLGTIAHSGSLRFKKEMEKSDDIDIIGQFGVGFYSAWSPRRSRLFPAASAATRPGSGSPRAQTATPWSRASAQPPVPTSS